jgi:hypothetical protein
MEVPRAAEDDFVVASQAGSLHDGERPPGGAVPGERLPCLDDVLGGERILLGDDPRHQSVTLVTGSTTRSPRWQRQQ